MAEETPVAQNRIPTNIADEMRQSYMDYAMPRADEIGVRPRFSRTPDRWRGEIGGLTPIS